jgi:CRP/FNR family transcriptional regulator, cyclic AMP receptor protein
MLPVFFGWSHMLSTYIINHLEKLGVSRSLVIRDIHLIKTFHLAEGESLDQASTLPAFGFIQSGLIAYKTGGETGYSTPERLFGANSWFGYYNLVAPQSNSFRYQAWHESHGFHLPKEFFLKLFNSEPAFARHVANQLAERAQLSSHMLAISRLGNPLLKTAAGIASVIVAVAYDSKWCDSTLTDQTSTLPLGQARLMDVCGLCRTDVWRACQVLIEAGFLKISYGKISVPSALTWSRWMRRHMVNRTNFKPKPIELLKELQDSDVHFR